MTVLAKELVARFKAADWPGAKEIDAFVRDLGPVPADATLKVLESLLLKGADKDERYRLRCGAFDKLVRKSPDRALFGPLVNGVKTADPALRAVLVAGPVKAGIQPADTT